MNSIWGSGASDIFAVGDFGTILHYDGSSWTYQDSATDQHLWGVWGSSGSEVFAVGHKGTIVRYDGSSWRAEASGTTEGLQAVWGAGTSMWAVGTAGVILHRTITPPPALPPTVANLVADDPDDGDTNFGVGDTLTISFNTDTNTPVEATGAKTGTEMASLFALSAGSFGGGTDSYTLSWPDARTLLITVDPLSKANIDSGETVSLL